jgi:two-component system, NarL family, invasion response regulator UvrY
MNQILIADDHAVVRYGTLLILKDAFAEMRFTEAADLAQVLDLLTGQLFDLLILDINIPGGNNLNMIDAIRLRQPQIKIMIFSGYDEHLYARRYLQHGVQGYLSKHSPEMEIVVAVETILFKKEIYASTNIKQQLLSGVAGNKVTSSNPLDKLSNRELDVTLQLIKGVGLAEISASLNLQISTVSTYKTRIFEKLEVTNVIDLAELVKIYLKDT